MILRPFCNGKNAFGVRRYLKVQDHHLRTTRLLSPSLLIPIIALKPTRRNIPTQPEVQITGSLTFISNFLPIVHRNWKDDTYTAWWRIHISRHIQHRIITLQLFSTIIISNIINSPACYISHYLEETNDVCFRRRFIQTATAKGRLSNLLFTIAINGYGL